MALVVNSLMPEIYLKSVRKAGLERSVWKFVVIETPEAFHFVCGPVVEYTYHASLVALFCKRNEIGAVRGRKSEMVEILDTKVRVHGGGHIQINLLAKRMKIYGRSTAYGPYNPDHLVGLSAFSMPVMLTVDNCE